MDPPGAAVGGTTMRPGPRGSQALVADWDNTLARGFLIIPWAIHLADEGIIPTTRVDHIRELAHSYESDRICYGYFAQLVTAEYTSAVDGCEHADILRSAEDFAKTDYMERELFELGHFLLEAAEASPVDFHIISAAPVEPLSACLKGKHLASVTGLGSAGMKIDASIRRFTGSRHDKESKVAQIAQFSQIVLGIGDSASDIPLLEAAETRVVSAVRLRNVSEFPNRVLRTDPNHVDLELRETLARILFPAGGGPWI